MQTLLSRCFILSTFTHEDLHVLVFDYVQIAIIGVHSFSNFLAFREFLS